jgi:hypothetical protein
MRSLPRDQLRDRLLAFATARREQYREDRKARSSSPTRFALHRPVLALLTLVSAVVTAMLMDGEHPGSTVLLVVCAGGLGAVLGSLRPVREEVTAGADLRAYLPAVVVEPLLGAVAGLLSLMIGETGVLGPTTADGDVWARAGLLAFAAGFAEPLVLRAISRLAGMPGDDLGRRPAVAHRPNPDGDDAPGRSPATRQGEVPKPRRRNGGATASAPSAAPSKRADRVRRSDSTPGPA